MASLLVGAQNLHAEATNGKIKVGLIGLGGRAAERASSIFRGRPIPTSSLRLRAIFSRITWSK